MAINLTDSLNAATTKGKLGDAKQVFLNGDTKNLQQAHEETNAHLGTLDNRSTQMENAIKDISVSGGASTANAVSYDNSTSGLEAVNAQGALDELQSNIRAETTSIIGTERIADGAVTTEKLADSAIDDEPTVGSDNLVKSGGVANKLAELETEIEVCNKEIENLSSTDDDSFTVADSEGNIAMSVDSEGNIDAIGFGNNLSSIIGKEVKSGEEESKSYIDERILEIYQPDVKDIDDNLFAVTDNDGNIAMSVDDKGKIDALGFGDNLSSIIDVKQSTSDIYRNNYVFSEIEKTKDTVLSAVKSLISLKTANPTKTIQVTTPTFTKDMDNVVVRLGLHKGSSSGIPTWDEIFFDGDCNNDFSDIRVKDSDGKILDYRMIHNGNYEVIKDKRFLNNRICYDSQKRLFQYTRYTEDGGTTWRNISGTIFADWDILFIDSRDYIYGNADGRIWLLKPDINANYSFDNKIEVVDMRVTNGQTNIYPKGSAGVETTEGYIFFGQYQLNSNPVLFRSINKDMTPDANGKYFRIIYSQTVYDKDGNTGRYQACMYSQSLVDEYSAKLGVQLGLTDVEKTDQHCHNLYYHAPTNTIYASFDNSESKYGPCVFKSIDNGNTWTQVVIDKYWASIRSRDYTPAYINPSGTFAIGGGETGMLGGHTLNKIDLINEGGVLREIKSYTSLKSHGTGIRQVKAWDNDEYYLVTGLLAQGGGRCTARIATSTDKGKTWKSIYHNDDFDNDSSYKSGYGIRYLTDTIVAKGTDEKCIYCGGYGLHHNPLRIMVGGTHYYGEIYVNVGHVNAGQTITLTIENNYAMAMPKAEVFKRDIIKPIFHLPLNEGQGTTVRDMDGNEYPIIGRVEWDSYDESADFGDFVPKLNNYVENSGLSLKQGAFIKLGKISKLRFNKGFSVMFGIRVRGLTESKDWNESFKPIIYSPNGMSVSFQKNYAYFGNETTYARKFRTGAYILDDYIYICFVLSGTLPLDVNVYENSRMTEGGNKPSSWSFDNLSNHELYIGCPNVFASPTDGINKFVNDEQYYINNIMIFDKPLTRDEYLSIVYGKSVDEKMFNN